MSLRRFIFATDLHGDKQDSATIKTLHEFTKDFKPHDKIFGGDIFDLRPLRRGAGAEEQAESMLNDWTAGCEFLRQWKPNYVLEGNHDKRLYDLAENHTAGIKADYAMKGCIELAALYGKLKCVVKPYHKRLGILQLGNVRFLHGFHHGVNACRQHALVYGSCIFGHIHAADSVTIAGLDKRVAMSSGALCEIEMSYNSAHTSTLRHSNGWIYGTINDKTKDWQAWHARRDSDGKWFLPTGFKEF